MKNKKTLLSIVLVFAVLMGGHTSSMTALVGTLEQNR